MKRIEKTIFISYRRSNVPWALAIFKDLTDHGYDVFFDFEGVSSGDFERVILDNIKARAHFLVLLTPSALERCDDPGDWLRREIETAIDNERNIVPLMLEGFDFSTPSIAKKLTGKLAILARYNALRIPADYFDAAMDRLRERYLNVPLDAVLHPTSDSSLRAVRTQKAAAQAAPRVRIQELTAVEWFERAAKTDIPSEREACYSEAIRLMPNYAEAYAVRGWARKDMGKLDAALQDLDKAIRLRPDYAEAYWIRGVTRQDKDDLDGALEDYDTAIRLKPDLAGARLPRGILRHDKGEFDGALEDLDRYLQADPNCATAYYLRGRVRSQKHDRDGALQDFDAAIRLESDNGEAHLCRGLLRHEKGEVDAALQDYDAAIRLKPDNSDAHHVRGLARKSKGDLNGALEDFDEAVRLKPDYAAAYSSRASIRASKHEYDAALQDLDKAIRLKPDDIEDYRIRGLLRAINSDIAPAIDDLQKYLDLGGTEQASVRESISKLRKML